MKEEYLDQAIDWAKRRSSASLKVKRGGYEEPQMFKNKTTNLIFQPDIVFSTQVGVSHFADIAIKGEDPQYLVTRWKLFSMMASLANGKLFLLTPKGHKLFTENLVSQYKINASIQAL